MYLFLGEMMKIISVIIPCYNEEECLEQFDIEIFNIVEQLPEYVFEILYIDDGSEDGSLKIIRELKNRRKEVKYISFSRNFGKEAAMYAGMQNAKGDYIAVMDADLQHPPRILKKMIRILEEGDYDCVVGKRMDRKGEWKVRSFGTKLFYKFINQIADMNIVDGVGDFRIMKRAVAEVVVHMFERNRFSKGIFSWMGFQTYEYAYENTKRAAGRTKWSFVQLVKYSLEGIVNFSNKPLHIASFFGMLCTLASVLAVVFIIIRKLLYGDPVQGWASTICVLLFVGGVQLFCIGVSSEYIAKMYTEVKGRPHYIVKECSNSDMMKWG